MIRHPPKSTLFPYPPLFRSLRSDHRTDGSHGPLRDVDPFTVLGTFNRGIRHEARALIARAYGEEFGVEPPYPTTFAGVPVLDRKSTRLNSSHANISYAVFCL